MNKTYKKICDILVANNIEVKNPIMLTADQFDKSWSIASGWTSTGVKIAKTELSEAEIRELESWSQETDNKGKVIVNRVFEAQI